MDGVPSKEELEQEISLVTVKVTGQYISMIDDSKRGKKNYTVEVDVPVNFNMSDVKRLTPRVLSKKSDFVSLRTYEVKGEPKKTDTKMQLKELYSEIEIQRFERLHVQMAKQIAKSQAVREGIDRGIDQTLIDPKTGLPPVING